MSNKIIIAKPGFNVLTETDPDNLIFSSDYNTLKYAISGHYEMLNVTDNTDVTIAHNLGYVPFFLCFCNDFVAQPTYYGMTEFFNSLGGRLQAARAYVDSTNLYLSLNLAHGSAITVEWYYKIFKNNLGL
jgi:hypothetical protein